MFSYRKLLNSVCDLKLKEKKVIYSLVFYDSEFEKGTHSSSVRKANLSPDFLLILDSRETVPWISNR